MSVETVVEEVKAEAVKLVEEAKAVVTPEAKKIETKLSAEEALVLRTAEVDYLKSTMEIQRLTKITEEKAKQYQTAVDGYLVKRGISKAEYLFDGIALEFKKIESKL
jgi:uncharacterized protein YeeX (DUF496 family)